jgi:branched-chain amino acid transport system substrate-binding protein
MRSVATRFLSLTAAAAAVLALAACTGNASGSTGGKCPIVIGASLSLTGDFSTDGQAFERGYELWANSVNSHGGLLGRKVKLDILNDASSQSTVVTNYTKLIASDKVNLVFGPFSTLLTVPAARLAARYGDAMIEGAGGGPIVFSSGLHNVFDVSPTIAQQLVPFAHWVAALPPSERPKTAAYPMVNDPFADPMVQTAQSILVHAGVKTVYSQVYPAENPDYKAGADQVAATKAQMVVLGSVDVPTAAAFITAFEQQHYNPQIFAASAGPDQGQAFMSAVGVHNVSGIMVPGGWYGGFHNALSQAMVKAYLAKYGGTPAGVNADVAEAYSVGQVTAAAVKATNGTDQTKIVSYLHKGGTLQTVQGSVKFNRLGQNVAATMFVFQWAAGGHYNQVLPLGAVGDSPIVNPRPAWGKG